MEIFFNQNDTEQVKQFLASQPYNLFYVSTANEIVLFHRAWSEACTTIKGEVDNNGEV